MATKQKDEKYVVYSVKIPPAQAAVFDKICDILGVNSYQILQMFVGTMIRAASPMHELDPRIRKVMTMMETEASWKDAFNMANPNALKVAQCILILEQEGKRGFGAVMIDRPFMGEARMTECADDIMERTCEVTMRGIYRRLRLKGGEMDCRNLSDVLLTMIDAQTLIELEEENRIQMQGDAQYDERGKRIEYGKKTKSTHRRTPDGEANRQQRIVFTDEDRELAKEEANRDRDQGEVLEEEMGFKPFGSEW